MAIGSKGITAPLPLRSSQLDYDGWIAIPLRVTDVYEGPSVRLARD